MDGGLEKIGRPGLESFLYVIDPQPTYRSATKIAQMREYLPELLEFAGKQKIKPRLISLLPDHDRIVMELEDATAAKKLLGAFSTSGDYQIKDNRFIPGDKEIYATKGPYKNIEVKLAVERKVRVC
jgi:hypothetical protein